MMKALLDSCVKPGRHFTAIAAAAPLRSAGAFARALVLGAGVGVLAACQQAAPPAAPVAPSPSTISPAAIPPPPESAPAIVVTPGTRMPSLDFPPGPLYVCDVAGTRTTIDYEPRVDGLCRRHPEMGPCQYERNACRAKGGRVYTQKNEEITLAVESEYDRVVRRVRFQADGGGATKAAKAK